MTEPEEPRKVYVRYDSEAKAGEREVINPSDRIFIQYEADPEAAQAAVIMLGRGAYGIMEGPDGKECLPILIFGAVEWCQNAKGKGIREWMESIPMKRIAQALDSVRCDGERTSMNDIAGNAKLLAAHLRKIDANRKENPA